MTLQECKDQVIREKGYTDHETMNLAAKLYASEKVKEALKVVAERATIWVETEINGTEFDKIVEDLGDGCVQTYTVFKERILSLETELLNNINKEI